MLRETKRSDLEVSPMKSQNSNFDAINDQRSTFNVQPAWLAIAHDVPGDNQSSDDRVTSQRLSLSSERSRLS